MEDPAMIAAKELIALRPWVKEAERWLARTHPNATFASNGERLQVLATQAVILRRQWEMELENGMVTL